MKLTDKQRKKLIKKLTETANDLLIDYEVNFFDTLTSDAYHTLKSLNVPEDVANEFIEKLSDELYKLTFKSKKIKNIITKATKF